MTFTHTPTALTKLWLAISLPAVAWDFFYVIFRPHSMPGGSMHWPVWVPYALYGEVDHNYGWKQWNAGNGFTAAQSWMNLIETIMYLIYAAIWWSNKDPVTGQIKGRKAALAVLCAFASGVMTESKTVLYWLNEACSDFENIRQNDLFRLVVLWMIPNGLWLVFPAKEFIYGFGKEILDGLAGAETEEPTYSEVVKNGAEKKEL
ncbi:hypothetical protein QBC40DRAFT_277061 [Triangularia verruculosa]|uniref:Uncharacterized protein n=1 Tax=Triangularia verruculosa TaxID=2587418 RepID=A0AAN6XPE3_9PEZI|nr:hypothetical protein QBC40DRAFT_277061 [Triangularia verruculosa]